MTTSNTRPAVYQLAHDFSLLTNRCIFLTGKAGTGKTTFLHQLREETTKQMVIAAPTGIAAIHAGGVTLHSLFQLPLSPFIPTPEGTKELIATNKMRAERRKILQEMELLVIDEVSMLRADVLDAIDVLLRHFKYKKNVPFGGVQVLLIGDLFQLSPVLKDAERHLLSPYYAGCYFFQSHVWQQINPVHIELDKIFRQKNQDFVDILNQVRNNRLTPESLARLNGLYNPHFVSSDDDFHVTLTTHNRKADSINATELAKIKEKTERFTATVQGEFQEKNYPTDYELKLKIGARVMFVKNDDTQPRRFYNGQIGMVENIDNDIIYVNSDNETIEVIPMAWRNLRYSVDDKTKKINEEQIGAFVQYPLRLAWAITIHKSQGLTFDKVVIDAENAFAPGQVYVALSRCRELSGVVMLSRINTTSLHNAPEILTHEQSKLPVSELEKVYRQSERNYQIQLFSSIFDFQPTLEQIGRFQQFLKKHAASVNAEAYPFAEELLLKMNNISPVGSKFAVQLAQILGNENAVDTNFLRERFAAASGYFDERIKIFVAYLKEAPVRTDVKATAKEMNEMLKEMHDALMLKIALMQGMKEQPTVLSYFLAKQNFKLTTAAFNTHASAKTELNTSSQHPELLRQLLGLRNTICKEAHLPLYIVGSTQMLIDISNTLPQNKAELLTIKGMGKMKFERFGHQLLDAVTAYTIQHDISAIPFDIPEEPKPKKEKTPKETKPKREKGESQRTTLALYKEGKSIDQIVEERNLALTTIVGHLYQFVQLGELSLDSFISPQKCKAALKLLTENSENSDRYALMHDYLTPIEFAFFFEWKRGNNEER